MTHLYNTLVNAIQQASTVKAAVIRTELAVGLIHFTQENNNTDTQGKSNLKSVYHGAGYDCLTKSDSHYKRVNHKINTTAKLFDKLTSSVVNGWVEGLTDDNAGSMISKVTLELEVYAFHSWDDIAEFVGVESNRTRKARTPASVPTTKPEPEQDQEQEIKEVATVDLDLDQLHSTLLSTFGDEMLREFCAKILVSVADREQAQQMQAA